MLPALVEKAKQLASSQGFDHSCLDEVGMLLSMLAGQVTAGPMLELGTGCGVGTAWMASSSAADLYSIDHDAALISRVQSLFSHQPRIHLLCGDWTRALDYGPFRLIFVDVKAAKASADQVVTACGPGGLVLLDDLTPEELWPDDWKGKPDNVREQWLHHPQLKSLEIRTSRQHSAILASKLS